MKKIFIKALIFLIAIFINHNIYAQKTECANKRLITSAQVLKAGYLAQSVVHLLVGAMDSKVHFNYINGTAKSSNLQGNGFQHKEFRFRELLKQMGLGIFLQLGGFCSLFYVSKALSKYISDLKGCKNKTDDSIQVPDEFNLELEEDVDKSVLDIAFNTWIIFSSLVLSYQLSRSYTSVYHDLNDKDLAFSVSNVKDLISAPALIPAYLYATWKSAKTIAKKMGNIIRSYKKGVA